jgi:nitrogen regulatory protein P-II 1
MAVNRNLIVTIIRKGWGDSVVEASTKAGAEGATILFGRGVGIHEHQQFLGIPIEPEKEVILSVTSPDKTDAILAAIVQTANLDQPGRGIAFVIPVERVVGIAHETTQG